MNEKVTALIDKIEILSSMIPHADKNDSFDSDDDVLLSHVANKLQGM